MILKKPQMSQGTVRTQTAVRSLPLSCFSSYFRNNLESWFGGGGDEVETKIAVMIEKGDER